MHRNFSIYLDFIRFSAAVAVFLDHFVSYPFTDHLTRPEYGHYGGIAVTIFFVLSGFVIAFVTDTREKNAYSYASARISRLYSVVIIALLITFSLDTLGSYLNPEFYSNKKVFWEIPSIIGYASSFFFVNEFQALSLDGVSPGSNAPFWSLSFEATYYVIAGFVLFSKRIIWIPLTVILLIFAGKTIAILFPIWLAGFALYRLKVNANISLFVSGFGLLATVMGILALPAISHHFPTHNFNHFFPYGRMVLNRNILLDYLTALIFIPHLIFANAFMSKIGAIKTDLEKIIRYLGSITFPMYLIHFPVLAFVASISPFPHNKWAHGLPLIIITMALIMLVTPLCDSLKNIMKSGLKNLKLSLKNS